MPTCDRFPNEGFRLDVTNDSCVAHTRPKYAVVGASLSEPHTSGTALRKCVCNLLVCLRPYTINYKCAFKYFPKIECLHGTMLCYCQSAALATVVEACTAPYFLFVTAATERPSMAGCSQTVQITQITHCKLHGDLHKKQHCARGEAIQTLYIGQP